MDDEAKTVSIEVVERLARIEAGQKLLCIGMQDLQKAIAKLDVQEERQINMKSRLDAAWIKLDILKEDHDKCPATSRIEHLTKQINWLWVLFTGIGLGFIGIVLKVVLGV